MAEHNQNQDLHYLLVTRGSELAQKVTMYDDECLRFCATIEAIVKRAKADSAVISNTITSMKVTALNFVDGKEPLLGWQRNAQGSYQPDGTFQTILDDGINMMPQFSMIVLPLPDADVRYGFLGEDIVMAVKDTMFLDMPDTTVISQEELETLKEVAPWQDRESFYIDQEKWVPQPILRSEAFRPSKEVREQNARWYMEQLAGPSLTTRFRNSLPGRALRTLGRSFS